MSIRGLETLSVVESIEGSQLWAAGRPLESKSSHPLVLEFPRISLCGSRLSLQVSRAQDFANDLTGKVCAVKILQRAEGEGVRQLSAVGCQLSEETRRARRRMCRRLKPARTRNKWLIGTTEVVPCYVALAERVFQQTVKPARSCQLSEGKGHRIFGPSLSPTEGGEDGAPDDYGKTQAQG